MTFLTETEYQGREKGPPSSLSSARDCGGLEASCGRAAGVPSQTWSPGERGPGGLVCCESTSTTHLANEQKPELGFRDPSVELPLGEGFPRGTPLGPSPKPSPLPPRLWKPLAVPLS